MSAFVLGVDDLSDVDLTGLADGDVIQYDSSSGNWLPVQMSGGGGGDLSDLSDVDIDNPQDGQALVYDDGDWVNQSVVIAVEHGANESVARPNAVVVYWKGSVSPDNAIDGDVWYDTSS